MADLVDKLGRAVLQRDENLREKSKAQAGGEGWRGVGHFGRGFFSGCEMGVVQTQVPKMDPGKWKQRPWWFNFTPKRFLVQQVGC